MALGAVCQDKTFRKANLHTTKKFFTCEKMSDDRKFLFHRSLGRGFLFLFSELRSLARMWGKHFCATFFPLLRILNWIKKIRKSLEKNSKSFIRFWHRKKKEIYSVPFMFQFMCYWLKYDWNINTHDEYSRYFHPHLNRNILLIIKIIKINLSRSFGRNHFIRLVIFFPFRVDGN